MTEPEVSTATLNRLSIYLRCLRELCDEEVKTVSSRELARRYDLSATQFRKDLAHFGEFGIRGVGYDTCGLVQRISQLLGLERQRRLIVIGMGNLGIALTRYFSGDERKFRVVGALDNAADKIGLAFGRWSVEPLSHMKSIIAERGAEIGVLAVPAAAAQATYDLLVEAGIQAVLNFAPTRLRHDRRVPTKNVDIGVLLEELTFHLSVGRGRS